MVAMVLQCAAVTPLLPGSDAALKEKGLKPSPVATHKSNQAKQALRVAATSFPYAGYNMYLESDEDYNSWPGWVSFKLNPFAENRDLMVLNDEAVPYSYIRGNSLYTFAPVSEFDTWVYDYVYTGIILNEFDANTLEWKSRDILTLPSNSMAYVPYIMTYDDTRGIVWAISMENGYTNGYSSTDYYLNIYDPYSKRLKRMGHLGSWSGASVSGNFNPKGFTAYGTGGILYLLNCDTTMDLCIVNPSTCEVSVLGATTMPTEYVYGLQPMIYDADNGVFVVDHYDFIDGTAFYQVDSWAVNGICNTSLIEYASTGYESFYRRPATVATGTIYQLDEIADMAATDKGNGSVTLSFTVPSTCDGGSAVDIPYYATDAVKATYRHDGEAVEIEGSSSLTLGAKTSVTFTNVADGVHTFSVALKPAYNELGGNTAGMAILVGSDAPAEVGNPTLVIADNVATITWDAPGAGLHSDFGNNFSGQGMTYRVVRVHDGKTIAEGISDCQTSDADIADVIRTYCYTIYAKCDGVENNGTTTNKVSAGQYIELPFTETFDDITSIDPWSIINANPDTYLGWQYNTYYGYMYAMSSASYESNDWLVSPTVSLTADKVYNLSFESHTWEGTPANFDIVLLKEADIANPEQTLANYSSWESGEDQKIQMTLQPAADGRYSVGIRFYGNNESMLSLDNFHMEEATSSAAPAAVSNLSVTAGANGALSIDISCTLPSYTINGEALDALTALHVYNSDGQMIKEITDVTPGQQLAMSLDASQGWNTVSVVAANAAGDGWPLQERLYVGLDQPTSVANFSLTWAETPTGKSGYTAHLTWDAPTVGLNGGYVDPSTITYTIYKYDDEAYTYLPLGSVDGETEVDVTILDATDAQDLYLFGLSAANAMGESDYVKSSIVLGRAYALPFNEPFSTAYSSLLHSPYVLVPGINNQNWSLDYGYTNDKIQPYQNDGIDLLLAHHDSGEGSGLFQMPIIDFAGVEHPVLSVYVHHSYAMPENACIAVWATLDGSKQNVEITPAQTLTGGNGWQQHIFDLAPLSGKKAQVSLYGYLPDPGTRIYADNIDIYDAQGTDLALTGVNLPYRPQSGQTAPIAVTVANLGGVDVDSYSVVLMNGEDILGTRTGSSLATAQTASFEFFLDVTSGLDGQGFSAVLICAADENEANNAYGPVTLTLNNPLLPAPTNPTLAMESRQLAWDAPESTDGFYTSTLDCEQLPSFSLNSFDGWTTYDGDGHLTLTFSQYYDNYWPYSWQPMAWMVWSAREAGAPTAEIWQPHSGEKCLVHFGNYGIDADGGSTYDEPDDDWLISPAIQSGTALSFWALTNSTENVDIEVMVSTTGTDLSDFTTRIGRLAFTQTSVWEEFTFQLPSDARYVAIHVIADDFGTLIDDITFTPAAQPVLQGFNVYHFSVLECQTAKDVNNTIVANTDCYKVSALYDLGESICTNTVGSSGVKSILNQGNRNITVTGGQGQISISGANGLYANIYNISGQAIMLDQPLTDTTVLRLPAGFYLVSVGCQGYKTMVY